MPEPRLDVSAFYAALDHARRSKNMSWRAVAGEAGVSPSTLTRLGQSRRPDVDSFGALIHWVGIDAEHFLREPRGSAKPADQDSEPIAMISTYLRARKELSEKSAAALEDILRAAYDSLKEEPHE